MRYRIFLAVRTHVSLRLCLPLDKHSSTRRTLLGTSCMRCRGVTAFSKCSLYTRASQRRRADKIRSRMFLFGLCLRSGQTLIHTPPLLGTSCMRCAWVTAFPKFSSCTHGSQRRRAHTIRPRIFRFVCVWALDKHSRTRVRTLF